MENQITPGSINDLVGFYLKRKRLELGLTGAQVGKLLYVSQQQISRYERGSNTVTLDFAFLFFKKLNLDLEEFFNFLLAELNRTELRSAETELSLYFNSLSPRGRELSI